MRKASLILILLLVICFSLAAWLQPRQAARLNEREPGGSVLAALLGDGRKMVADYFYVKADVYFHSGYYPSIFDQARQQEVKDSDVSHPDESGGEEEKEFMGPPKDWIERFSRHFLPPKHTHLEGEKVREMLPWMELSAELDPQRIQTYVVTAYWLRERLGKSDEAEQFLRDGLKANPDSAELLYVLGQIYLEDRRDLPRARNLLLAALRRWHEVEGPKPEKTETGEGERDNHLADEIIGALVKLEKAGGNPAQELEYLKQLKSVSPSPVEVQRQIDKLAASLSTGTIPTNPTPDRQN